MGEIIDFIFYRKLYNILYVNVNAKGELVAKNLIFSIVSGMQNLLMYSLSVLY